MVNAQRTSRLPPCMVNATQTTSSSQRLETRQIERLRERRGDGDICALISSLLIHNSSWSSLNIPRELVREVDDYRPRQIADALFLHKLLHQISRAPKATLYYCSHSQPFHAKPRPWQQSSEPIPMRSSPNRSTKTPPPHGRESKKHAFCVPLRDQRS